MQNSKNGIAELTGENFPEDLDICVQENTPTLINFAISIDLPKWDAPLASSIQTALISDGKLRNRTL